MEYKSKGEIPVNDLLCNHSNHVFTVHSRLNLTSALGVVEPAFYPRTDFILLTFIPEF